MELVTAVTTTCTNTAWQAPASVGGCDTRYSSNRGGFRATPVFWLFHQYCPFLLEESGIFVWACAWAIFLTNPKNQRKTVRNDVFLNRSRGRSVLNSARVSCQEPRCCMRYGSEMVSGRCQRSLSPISIVVRFCSKPFYPQSYESIS